MEDDPLSFWHSITIHSWIHAYHVYRNETCKIRMKITHSQHSKLNTKSMPQRLHGASMLAYFRSGLKTSRSLKFGANLPLSHAHTVVWECYKNDRQSQWEMAKFDPQPTLNHWTNRHQIWNTSLGRGNIPPKKFRGQSTQGFLPPHVRNHPKPLNVYCTFFSSSEPPQTSPLDRFSHLIRHTTWFCAR